MEEDRKSKTLHHVSSGKCLQDGAFINNIPLSIESAILHLPPATQNQKEIEFAP